MILKGVKSNESFDQVYTEIESSSAALHTDNIQCLPKVLGQYVHLTKSRYSRNSTHLMFSAKKDA